MCDQLHSINMNRIIPISCSRIICHTKYNKAINPIKRCMFSNISKYTTFEDHLHNKLLNREKIIKLFVIFLKL